MRSAEFECADAEDPVEGQRGWRFRVHLGRAEHLHEPESLDELRGVIPDMLLREVEPGLAVVLLLVENAVESDVAVAEVLHPSLPHRETVPSAAELRPRDVQSEEPESGSVRHARNARRRLAVQFA